MSTHSQQLKTDEELIDLQPYLSILLKYWWIILGLTVVGSLFGALFISPRRLLYEARAKVIIVPSRSELSLEPKFRTVSDQAVAKADLVSRRDALVGLVRNAAIATQVINTLKDQLPTELRDPVVLVEMVNGQGGPGDLIEIIVQADRSEWAALVANAWAVEYENYINQVYSGDAAKSKKEISQQVDKAKGDYESAQQALVDVLTQNRMDELKQQIEEKQNLVKSLEAARQSAFRKRTEAAVKTLDDYYQTKLKLEQLLADVKSLHMQIRQGGRDGYASNALAILLLKSGVYASSNIPGNLALQLSVPTVSETLDEITEADVARQLRDLQSMIDALQARLADLDQVISKLSQEMVSAQSDWMLPGYTGDRPFPQTIDTLQQEIRSLQAELEREQAKHRELVRARDLAWETYSTVARKLAELSVASDLTGTVVRRASPAIQPTKPLSDKQLRLRNVLTYGVIGLALSVTLALAVGYLRREL